MKKSDKQVARTLPVLIASIASALASFVLGFGLGYTSPIEEEVKTIGILDDYTFPVFSSSLFFSAITGALLGSLVTDLIGKKALLIFSSVPNAIGWLMVTFGYDWVVMVIGRVLTGLSLGVTTPIISLYIADIAPKEHKGFYGSIYQHAFIIGILMSHFIGIFVSFRWLALVPVVVLLSQSLLLIWQPYSPYWLVSRGLEKRGISTVKYLRGPKYDCLSEFEEMKEVVKENDTWTFMDRVKSLIFNLAYLRTIIIISFIMVCVELTGISVVASYSTSLLEHSILIHPKVASLLPTTIQCISVLLFTFLVDRIGRKPLLIVSGAGIALSHVILSINSFGLQFFWPQCTQFETTTNFTRTVSGNQGVSEDFCKHITLIPILALLILRFMYGLGWGPVPFVLLGESLPSKVRSISASVAICALTFSNALTLLLFPYLVRLIGDYSVFLLYVLANLTSCAFILLFVPETKGLNLTETEELFKGKVIFLRCKARNPFVRKDVYVVKTDS